MKETIEKQSEVRESSFSYHKPSIGGAEPDMINRYVEFEETQKRSGG